ncbi:hypothetical protein MUK42_34173 [Musa troglodytarum]|uniref:Uncharacterized protein n=1 Tax=Musa troglodytarum TaxID=320322 RepID=A0A9E7EAH1_9LILI|nr:hypothetical protein MUK42_34173 [Musa troglodytarum]
MFPSQVNDAPARPSLHRPERVSTKPWATLRPARRLMTTHFTEVRFLSASSKFPSNSPSKIDGLELSLGYLSGGRCLLRMIGYSEDGVGELRALAENLGGVSLAELTLPILPQRWQICQAVPVTPCGMVNSGQRLWALRAVRQYRQFDQRGLLFLLECKLQRGGGKFRSGSDPMV